MEPAYVPVRGAETGAETITGNSGKTGFGLIVRGVAEPPPHPQPPPLEIPLGGAVPVPSDAGVPYPFEGFSEKEFVLPVCVVEATCTFPFLYSIKSQTMRIAIAASTKDFMR
jgi:hypothetical protein